MAVYSGKVKTFDFQGGKNILASEHFQNIEGGATLDATAFDAGLVEVGTAIAQNTDSGKFEPFAAGTGQENHAILNVDFNNDGATDVVAGAVVVRGSVYEDKCQGVDQDFKDANPLIRYVK